MARRPDPARRDFIVGDSIADILAEASIHPGRDMPRSGHTASLLCPACSGGRSRAKSLSVTVDADGDGVVWQCHRANCPGCRGNGRIDSTSPGLRRSRDDPPQRQERKPPVVPRPHPPEQQDRGADLYAWFRARGIGEETVDAFGIYQIAERWPGQVDEWTTKRTFVFPYLLRGAVVARKFRSIDKDFRQDKDSLRSLYNVDAVESPDELVIVEGELDVLAMWEAGFRQVVSLPDGAPSKIYPEDDPRRQDDKRFAALATCGETLEPVKKIIIATDADVPGEYLAEELARRLGPERCFRVRWPDGCKDANAVLQKHGVLELQHCVAVAEPVPLKGLWSPAKGGLREFLTCGNMPTGLVCGITALDAVAQLPSGGGWLTCVTGIPAHGKGTLLRCWLPYVAEKHNMHIIWFSPEDGKAETLALDLIAVLKGQPLREAGTYMPADIFADGETWVRRHVTFIVADDPSTDPTLDWMLGRADAAIRRLGGRSRRILLVIDPWNEVEFTMLRGESEGQFTGRWLRRLKAWGRSHGASVLIAAHPTKLSKDLKTKKYPVADGYDVAGSANWHNKTDVGLTVYRERDGEMQVHAWKVKFRAFGARGVAKLGLDKRTGRLRSLGVEDDMTSAIDGGGL